MHNEGRTQIKLDKYSFTSALLCAMLWEPFKRITQVRGIPPIGSALNWKSVKKVSRWQFRTDFDNRVNFYFCYLLVGYHK